MGDGQERPRISKGSKLIGPKRELRRTQPRVTCSPREPHGKMDEAEVAGRKLVGIYIPVV